MRRGLWVAAAILVALAAAIPVWLALDDGGERNQAALTEATKTGALDCSQARVRGCPELNQALAVLDAELAGDQRAAEIAKAQAMIEENTFYKAGTLDDLSSQDALALQQALERRLQFMTTLSNLQKASQDTQQALINNLKG